MGRQLLPLLQAAGHQVIRGNRTGIASAGEPGALCWQGNVGEVAAALRAQKVQTLIHLAGLAHDRVPGATEHDLRRVNSEQTQQLYQACDQAAVGRFIWLSSIKVLGEESATPLAEDAPLQPQGAYAASKAAGEGLLQDAAQAAQTKLVIVRPPLVYGPGVSGNMRRLLSLADSPWPLPLGAANAPRTMVALTNLNQMLVRLLTADAGVYHACDAQSLSVADLLLILRQGMRRAPRLLPVPAEFCRGAARLLGQGPVAQRLFAPLLVSATATTERLDWVAPVTVEQAVQEMLNWYLMQT